MTIKMNNPKIIQIIVDKDCDVWGLDEEGNLYIVEDQVWKLQIANEDERK